MLGTMLLGIRERQENECCGSNRDICLKYQDLADMDTRTLVSLDQIICLVLESDPP